MSPLLGFLPLVLLALLTAALRAGRGGAVRTLREDALAAVLILGVFIGLGTELLGLFHAISFPGVLRFWLAGLTAGGVALLWRWRRLGPPARLRLPRLGVVDASSLGGVIAVALALLIVAWLAPPQSSDSLGYHMSRVMHWIQDRSLAPYPTHDSPQLFQPPLSEIVRLHLLLLTGSDRAGCLLQWFAAMGALAGASLVARDLGGGRSAQMFSAVLVMTLPIGVTQATSGKNGWVEALWLLALVHFSGAAARRGHEPPSRGRIVAAFAGLGLDLMTKITSWFFSLPVVVLAILGTPRTAIRRLLPPAAVGIVLVAALTFPYMGRNLAVFGNPIADPVYQSKDGFERVTPAIVGSSVLRHAAYQFATPNPGVNDAIGRWVARLERVIGADPSDPRAPTATPFHISQPTRAEEVARSPLHLLLLLGVGAGLLASPRLRAGGSRLPYLAALGAGYVLYCATVRWQAPSSRLLMPLLVLAAPLVAAVVEEAFRKRAVPALAVILFAACVPFVVATEARPLSFEPGRGILATPRIDLYFARVPARRQAYEDVARSVRAEGVRSLGVVFRRSGQPEYLLWVLLRDARPPVHVEHVAVTGASSALASRSPFAGFQPEMVVVFAFDVGDPRFDPEVVTAGTRYAFVRSSGSAGFYAPVSTDRSP